VPAPSWDLRNAPIYFQLIQSRRGIPSSTSRVLSKACLTDTDLVLSAATSGDTEWSSNLDGKGGRASAHKGDGDSLGTTRSIRNRRYQGTTRKSETDRESWHKYRSSRPVHRVPWAGRGWRLAQSGREKTSSVRRQKASGKVSRCRGSRPGVLRPAQWFEGLARRNRGQNRSREDRATRLGFSAMSDPGYRT